MLYSKNPNVIFYKNKSIIEFAFLLEMAIGQVTNNVSKIQWIIAGFHQIFYTFLPVSEFVHK